MHVNFKKVVYTIRLTCAVVTASLTVRCTLHYQSIFAAAPRERF